MIDNEELDKAFGKAETQTKTKRALSPKKKKKQKRRKTVILEDLLSEEEVVQKVPKKHKTIQLELPQQEDDNSSQSLESVKQVTLPKTKLKKRKVKG